MNEEQLRAAVRAWLAANAAATPVPFYFKRAHASRPAFGNATHRRRWLAEHRLAHAQ